MCFAQTTSSPNGATLPSSVRERTVTVTYTATYTSEYIDYTITCNGLALGDDDLTLLSMAHSYPSCDPEDVQKALDIAATNNKIAKNVKVPEIVAENGMGEALGSKRDVVYDTALAAKEADFDKVWDNAISDYLSSGGQAIMDERTEKFEAKYGSSTSVE